MSVFIGRHDDAGHRGMAIVEDVAKIFRHDPSITSKILAASIRHPEHLLSCALAGAHAPAWARGFCCKYAHTCALF